MNSWVFQANIKYYDIDGAVRSLSEIPWRVTNYINKIRKGDRVFIWRTGPDTGIIAIGTIVSDVSEISFSRKEMKFALKESPFKTPQIGVKVRIDRVLDEPIKKDFLKSSDIFSDMTILRRPIGTNFKLEPDEVKGLEGILRSKN